MYYKGAAIIYFLKWGLEKIKQPQFFNIKLIFIMANFMKLTTTNTVLEKTEIHGLKKVTISVGDVNYDIQFNEIEQHLVITKSDLFINDKFSSIEAIEVYTNIVAIK